MAVFEITANGIKSLNDYVNNPNGGPTANLSWAQPFLVDNTFDPAVFTEFTSTEDQYAYLQERALWGYDLNNPSLIMSRPEGSGTDPDNPPAPLSDAARRGMNLDSIGNNYRKAINIQGNPIRKGIKDVKYDYVISQPYGTYLFNLLVIFNAFGVTNPQNAEQMPIFSFYFIGESAKKIGGEGTIVINGISRYENGAYQGAIEWINSDTTDASYIVRSSVDVLPGMGDPEVLNGNNVYLIDSGNDVVDDGPEPYGRDSVGNPYTAIRKGDGAQAVWTFSNFLVDLTQGGNVPISSLTSTSLVYDDSGPVKLKDISTNKMGRYIVQFLDGDSIGVCRTVSEIDEANKTISWLVGVANDPQATKFALYEDNTVYIGRSAQINPGLPGTTLTMDEDGDTYAFRPPTFGVVDLDSERPWPLFNLDEAGSTKVHSNRYSVTLTKAAPYFTVPGYVDHVNLSPQHFRQTFVASGNTETYSANSFIATRSYSQGVGFSQWEFFYPSNPVDNHPVIQEIKKAALSYPQSKLVAEVESVPTTLGTYPFSNTVVGVDGNIYFVPYNQQNVGVYDVLAETFQLKNYGLPSGTARFSGAVCAPNGKLYFIPATATSVLIVDPITDTSTTTNFGLDLTGNAKWSSGVVGEDGKIYCVPDDSSQVLVINPANDTAVLTNFGENLTGTGKWRQGVHGPDGKIYCIPYSSTDILIIDPKNNTAVRSTMEADLTGVAKWRDGALGADGKIYTSPYAANDILVIDTVTGVATRTTLGANFNGLVGPTAKWAHMAVSADGKIVATPHLTDKFLVIDTINQTATFDSLGITKTINENFFGMSLAPTGTLYTGPFAYDSIGARIVKVYSSVAPPLSDTATFSVFLNK